MARVPNDESLARARPRRRAAIAVSAGVALVAAGGLVYWTNRHDTPLVRNLHRVDLASLVRTNDHRLVGASATLHAPTSQQLATYTGLVEELVDGKLTAGATAARQLDLEVLRGPDASGRMLTVVRSRQRDRRGWGLLVIADQGGLLSIEAPHPQADENTDGVAADLFTATSGRVLLIAGAHRRSTDGEGDAAHNPDAPLAAIHQVLAERHWATIQVHGFSSENHPSFDAVVSTGAADRNALATNIIDALRGKQLRVCAAPSNDCDGLEGTTNVEGQVSARTGAPFVHLELNAELRVAGDRRSAVLSAVGAAVKRSDAGG